MVGGIPRGHGGVHESDQVGERVIAEEQAHARLILLVLVNGVELLRPARGKSALVTTMEIEINAAAEDTFVGGHPVDAEFVGKAEDVFGDAAFGRPDATRAHAKGALVEIETAE